MTTRVTHNSRGVRPGRTIPYDPRTIVVLSGADLFEDFFDKIGVSLDAFRDEFTGGWLFNYIDALRLVAVRVVLLFVSARVRRTMHFTHVESGVSVWVVPAPLLHRKVRNGQHRYFPESQPLVAAASYVATPLRVLTRILRYEGCDAILCQEYEHPRFDTCVLLGRLLRLPVFATYQGGSETRTTLERAIRRVSMRMCNGLIIPSFAEIARVRHTYHIATEKIAAIPNPVDVRIGDAADRNATRTALGIGSNTRVVAWHGRVQIHTKGLDLLVDAWNHICSQRPDADIRLLLVGSGRNAAELRQRIGSNQRIVWIDQYVFSRQRLWSYLSAADVYTIPSRREGFAVAVLEAMACGLPVVASDAPGVAEIFPAAEDDGAIVVPRDDVGTLAAALMRLMDDPDLARRLGAIARRRAENDYALDVIGPRLRHFLFAERTTAARV
jgi:glycosyltransferase involved in cell wall biosynthesis